MVKVIVIGEMEYFCDGCKYGRIDKNLKNPCIKCKKHSEFELGILIRVDKIG